MNKSKSIYDNEYLSRTMDDGNMTIEEKINWHLQKAGKIAICEVYRLVVNELNSNKKFISFTMAMGTFFFIDKKGNTIGYGEYQCPLFDFILNWNPELRISGYAMHIEKGKNYSTIHW